MSTRPTANPDNFSTVLSHEEHSPHSPGRGDWTPYMVATSARTDNASQVASDTTHRHNPHDPPGYHDTASNESAAATSHTGGEPSGTSDEDWLRLPNGQLINAKNTLASHSTVATTNVTTVSSKLTEVTCDVGRSEVAAADSPPVVLHDHSSHHRGLQDTEIQSIMSVDDLEWNKELQHGTSAFETSNSATLKPSNVQQQDRTADPFANALVVNDPIVSTNPLPPVPSAHSRTIAPPTHSGSPHTVMAPVGPTQNWVLKTGLVLLALIFLAIATLVGVCLSGKCSSNSSPAKKYPAGPPINATVPPIPSWPKPAPEPDPTISPVTVNTETNQMNDPTSVSIANSTGMIPSNPRALKLTEYINDITLSGRTLAVATDIDTVSPEQLALQWLIEFDDLELSPSIPAEAFRLQQRYALQTLWVGHNASNPFIGSTGHECQWDGIACRLLDLNNIGNVSVVVAINWREFGWTGRIVSDLGLLSHLEKFDMFQNFLTGPLPESIGNWTNLLRFDMFDNELNGTLPDFMHQWANLEEFDVSNNDFTGTLPESIGQWNNLVWWDVSSNQLTGSLPESIGLWTHLRWFAVGDNQFTGSLPFDIGQWTNLEYFSVYGNELNGTLPFAIGNWTSLTDAYFWGNNFIGSVPITLCSAANLTDIMLDCGLECSCNDCDCI